MKKSWLEAEGKFYYKEIPSIQEELPKGVYQLKFEGGLANTFLLEKVSEKFELPEKLYDLEKNLVERVKNTFIKTDKSFGVIFKGLKGTGKTISAKKISNDLDIPVILINDRFENLGSFINLISQDVILFFDEFEKTFNISRWGEDSHLADLLSLMDGVFTSTYKRLFLLTSNNDNIPDSLLSRPSRIRYVRDFSDISKQSVTDILEDLIEDKSLIPELLLTIKTLKFLTVDIIKSLAEEVNLYNRADPDFFEIFNLTKNKDTYDLYDKNNKLIAEKIDLGRKTPRSTIYDYEGNYLGVIYQIDEIKKTLILRGLNSEDFPGLDELKLTYKKSRLYHKYYEF